MGLCASNEQDPLPVLKKTPFAYRLSSKELQNFANLFTCQTYKKGETITDQNADAEFFVVASGRVDISFEGNFLATKGPNSFFGQIAFTNAAVLERKETLHSINAKHDMEEDGAKRQNVGQAALTKRESLIENARLATVVASTDCSCIMLPLNKLEDFLQSVSERTRTVVTTTMGASASKNLGAIPFLQNLPDRKLRVLSELLHYVPLKAGDVLFEEGSVGTEMYIVYIGSCKAVAKRSDPDNPSKQVEVLLNTFEEGDFFGEISLIMNMPRTAGIKAVEDSLLLELRSDDFQNFLKLAPNLPLKDLMKRRFANHFKKYDVPFFAAIPENKYPLLADLCSVDQFGPDTTIFEEGEMGHTFYIIAYGEVVVTARKDRGGQKEEIELTRMGPGRYFGEIALIRDTLRTATVRTLTRCVILSVTKENFQTFFEEAPEALADFEVKLARYDCAMRSIIYHPLGLDYFTKFLEREYSAENIHFWAAAREYRHIADPNRPRSRVKTPKNASSPLSKSDSTPTDINKLFLPNSREAKAQARWSFSHSVVPEANETEAELDMQNAFQNQYQKKFNEYQKRKASGLLDDEEKEEQESLPGDIQQQLRDKATEIYHQFISPDAPEQVNINGEIRDALKEKIQAGNVTPHLFNLAEKEILALIERDSFSRFKQSPMFQEFLRGVESYDEEEEVPEIAQSQANEKLRAGSILHQGAEDERRKELLKRLSDHSLERDPASDDDASDGNEEQADLDEVEVAMA